MRTAQTTATTASTPEYRCFHMAGRARPMHSRVGSSVDATVMVSDDCCGDGKNADVSKLTPRLQIPENPSRVDLPLFYLPYSTGYTATHWDE